MLPRVTLGGLALPQGLQWPQGVTCGLRGLQVTLGVADGLMGLQMVAGSYMAIRGSWVAMRGCRWPWGVASGLGGCNCPWGVAGDTNYISHFYKCPKLRVQTFDTKISVSVDFGMI
jgi:hypothetical protein